MDAAYFVHNSAILVHEANVRVDGDVFKGNAVLFGADGAGVLSRQLVLATLGRG